MVRKAHTGTSGVEVEQTGSSFVPINMMMVATDEETEEKLRAANVFKTIDLAGATAETTVWTPAAGKRFRFMGMVLTTDIAAMLTFRDGTAGTVIFIVRLAAGVPFVLPNDLGLGMRSGAINTPLTVTRSAIATLTGTLFGTEE